MEGGPQQLEGSVILRPAGRIDLSNAEPFKNALLDAVAAAKTAVFLDLSGIEYVSSAGLRSLMIASKTAKPRGVALGVAALRPVVKEIFTISRFDLVVPCSDTLREAVAKLDPAALAKLDTP
jgi:anti-sigma B factor antagonist/stage II sporulation protein AA (anti-sigma F factor antagonist)